jgi:hypothetical protein
LGARSLILTPVGFLLVTFLAFFGVGRVVTTLHLPARVFDDPAREPFDDAPTDLALRVWAERGIVGIGVPPSNLGMGVMKVSKACKHAYKE